MSINVPAAIHVNRYMRRNGGGSLVASYSPFNSQSLCEWYGHRVDNRLTHVCRFKTWVNTASKSVTGQRSLMIVAMYGLMLLSLCFWSDFWKKSYCRVWPADLPDDQVVADNFLRIEASNNNVTDAPSSKVVPVRVYQIALEATLTVSIKKGISEEAQKRDLAFVFEDGTAHMKQEVHENWFICLKSKCIAKQHKVHQTILWRHSCAPWINLSQSKSVLGAASTRTFDPTR